MDRLKVLKKAPLALALLIIMSAGLSAVAKRSAKYVGSDTCMTCHESMHGSLVKAYSKTPHHLAMADVAVKPDAIAAKFSADSPVKKDEIKYILGVGKRYQSYLNKDFQTLPGKWDTKEQKWIKTDAADSVTQCIGCHTTNFDPDSKKWTEMGVGCESCHGPGGVHAESMDGKDINNLKKLDSQKLNMVCGQCHSQGTDTEGKLAFSSTFMPGDDLNAHMKHKTDTDHLPNSQYNQFITSNHAKHGMKCTKCHDPHGNKAKSDYQLKKPVTELCLDCHSGDIGSLKSHAPDAGDNATCATCHMPGGSHQFKKHGK